VRNRKMIADESEQIFRVVLNGQEQYSIWPAERVLPEGWSYCSQSGTQQECLDFIDRVWTDMRPRSLRKEMKRIPRIPTAAFRS
jgi:MbtH protein